MNPVRAIVRSTTGWRRQAAKLALVASLAGGGLVASTATAADAATIRSYGMVCNGQYNWVRNNFPDIATSSSTPSNVYFRSNLFVWNGRQWSLVTSSPLYNGVSTSSGRRPLGTLAFGVPYYFVNSATGGVATEGHTFRGLVDGRHYATFEQYIADGQLYQRWSTVARTGAGYCTM